MTPQCICKIPEITRDNPKVCKKCGWFIDLTSCNQLTVDGYNVLIGDHETPFIAGKSATVLAIDEYQTSEQEQLMQSVDRLMEEPERRFFEIKPTYSDKPIERRKPIECFGGAVSAGQKAKRLRMMKRKKK